MEKGRVCVKIAGREAGKKCVVLDNSDKNNVIVCGPGVRKRKCNIAHLQPLSQVFKVTKTAGEKEIYALFGAEYKEKAKKAPKPQETKKKPEEKKEDKPKKDKPKKPAPKKKDKK